MLQKLLKSELLSPSVGSSFAGRLGGGKLSKSGREFIIATREVLEAIIRVGMEKNEDDKVSFHKLNRRE